MAAADVMDLSCEIPELHDSLTIIAVRIMGRQKIQHITHRHALGTLVFAFVALYAPHLISYFRPRQR